MKILVMMVGAQGSGKTHYCENNLKGYFRVSQDDQGRKEHLLVFNDAIERGEPLIVVDRINAERVQRGRYLVPAKKAGYRTKIVWLTTEKDECLKRCRSRRNHPTLAADDAEKAINMYFSRLQAPSRREADELEVIGPAPYYVRIKDIREEIGDRHYVVVGDIHGCLDELKELLDLVKFDPVNDVLVSVGDIIDRGPKIKETVEFLQALPRFYSVMGNHEEKMLRLFRGTPVKVANGLQMTIDSFGGKVPDSVADWVRSWPLILQVPDGYVVHGGFDPLMSPTEQNKADCIYMRYFGGENYFDSLGGTMWYKLWPSDAPRVFFGHDPHPAGPNYNNICHLDGGCVFGDYLKAWSSRDKIVYYVNAKQKYSTHGIEAALSNPNEEVKRREVLMNAGLLRGDRTDDGALAVYTYTDNCVFSRAWDNITLNSRGHVFNLASGECVARSMKKFFNLGENMEVMFDNLPWNQPYEVFEKLDGWLGNLYRHQGKMWVSSRGSFHSDGAKWASEFIQTRDLSFLPDDVTLVFEIITPEQKIILDYKGEKTLYVLAAFNRHTGEEYPRSKVEEWARLAPLPIVQKYESLKIEDCLRISKEVEGKEGFVIRFHDGRRVKVKTEWYCRIAKIMANLTPISMWECMKDGKIPGERMREIPEELRPLAEQYKERIEAQFSSLKDDVFSRLKPLLEANKDSGNRKAFALEAAKMPSLTRRCAFLLLDKKSIDQVIMDEIYPKGNNWVDTSPLGLD